MCETDRDPWLLGMDLTDVSAVDLIFLGGLDPTFLMQLAPQVWLWTQNDNCSLGPRNNLGRSLNRARDGVDRRIAGLFDRGEPMCTGPFGKIDAHRIYMLVT